MAGSSSDSTNLLTATRFPVSRSRHLYTIPYDPSPRRDNFSYRSILVLPRDLKVRKQIGEFGLFHCTAFLFFGNDKSRYSCKFTLLKKNQFQVFQLDVYSAKHDDQLAARVVNRLQPHTNRELVNWCWTFTLRHKKGREKGFRCFYDMANLNFSPTLTSIEFSRHLNFAWWKSFPFYRSFSGIALSSRRKFTFITTTTMKKG